jgi:hypothetical protein
MKTKSIVITLAILITASTLQAQSMGRPLFGIRGGVNFQNLNGKDASGDKLENKLKAGFHLGVDAAISVAPDFYIQPGVLFSTKGAKSEDGDTKINLSYIEVPINLLYRPLLGTGKLILGFGPYVAFGIGGKVDEDGGDKTDIKFASKITPAEALSDPYMKRFDAGANIFFGYEFSNRVFTQINAQLGLVNINPEIEGVDDKSTLKNTGFGLSVGYRF